MCLRPECCLQELNEDTPGWEAFKSVGYCMECISGGSVRDDNRESPDSCSSSSTTTKYPRSESPFSWNNDSDDTDVIETSESDNSVAVKKGKRKTGRKSIWQESNITDMVDIIVNDEELVRKLVFTNIKKSKNTDAYEKVLPQLNTRYQETFEENFPFTVQQMRTKFKWCISVCKKVCLTIKTASGVRNFVDEKGYGDWFNLLYPLVKTRDSCQPERACEPSAHDGAGSSTCDHDNEANDSGDPLEKRDLPDKSMYVPVKKPATKKHKTDAVAKSLELLQTTIENDPTKELLQILREDMKHSREEETRHFNLLCGMMTYNQGFHVPSQEPDQVFQFTSTNGNPQCQNQGNLPQPSNVPFTQPRVQPRVIHLPGVNHLPGDNMHSPMVHLPEQSTPPLYHELRPVSQRGGFAYKDAGGFLKGNQGGLGN